MINEKAREGLSLWGMLKSNEATDAAAEKATLFFVRVFLLRAERNLTLRELSSFITFLTHAFASLEVDTVNKNLARLVSLPLWLSLPKSRLDLELTKFPQLHKPWDQVVAEHAALAAAPESAQVDEILGSLHTANQQGRKRRRVDDKHASSGFAAIFSSPALLANVQKRLDASFFPCILTDFFALLESEVALVGRAHKTIERYMAFFVDLLAQLPTRRFLHSLFDNSQFLLRAHRSALAQLSPFAIKPEEGLISTSTSGGGGSVYTPTVHHASTTPQVADNRGRLFTQLLDMVDFFLHFNIESQTGKPLTEMEHQAQHYASLQTLQRLVFKHFSAHMADLKEMALSPVGAIANPKIMKVSFLSVSKSALLEHASNSVA
jgi:hypothetical protein